MRVLLATPPNRAPLRSEAPVLLRQTTQMPPLGLVRLASALRRGGHEVRLLDLAARDGDDADALRVADEFRPALVGVGSTTAQIVDACRLLGAVKARDARIATVLGGPHVKFFAEASARYDGVDIVLAGEADHAIVALANALSRGEDAATVPGVFTARDGEVRRGPEPEVILDLEALGPVERDWLGDFVYRDPAMPGRLATTEMVRGCPYDCSFCSTPRGVIRMRSATHMADEMESIAKRREADSVYFVDDTWNVNPRKCVEFCEELARRPKRPAWMARLRINTMKPELVAAMRAAGCVRVQLGVEAGSDEGMVSLRKRLKVEQVRAAFRLAREHGIDTMGYFMLGLPSDRTVDDVRGTVEFARSLRPTYVLFNVFTPYPHTELYDDGVRRGIVDAKPWDEFVRRPTAEFSPQPWTEHLAASTLYAEMARAYRRFYLRPRRIVAQLLRPATWGKAAQAAYGLLRA